MVCQNVFRLQNMCFKKISVLMDVTEFRELSGNMYFSKRIISRNWSEFNVIHLSFTKYITYSLTYICYAWFDQCIICDNVLLLVMAILIWPAVNYSVIKESLNLNRKTPLLYSYYTIITYCCFQLKNKFLRSYYV